MGSKRPSRQTRENSSSVLLRISETSETHNVSESSLLSGSFVVATASLNASTHLGSEMEGTGLQVPNEWKKNSLKISNGGYFWCVEFKMKSNVARFYKIGHHKTCCRHIVYLCVHGAFQKKYSVLLLKNNSWRFENTTFNKACIVCQAFASSAAHQVPQVIIQKIGDLESCPYNYIQLKFNPNQCAEPANTGYFFVN